MVSDEYLIRWVSIQSLSMNQELKKKFLSSQVSMNAAKKPTNQTKKPIKSKWQTTPSIQKGLGQKSQPDTADVHEYVEK